MISQNLTSLWKHEDRFYILAGNLIFSLMLACMVVSIVQLGELAWAGFDGGYLVALGFLVSLEALLSRRILKGDSIFDPEWLIFRGTELVVILLAVKLAYYAQHGLNQLLIDAARWLQDFLYTFMTPEYGFGCLVIALVWVLSSRLAEDLALLYVDERILRQEAESGIYEERDKIREHLVGMLLGIGLGMIVLAALLRSSQAMSWVDLPVMRAGVINLLIYFLLFLVFLSLTQFSLMRANWMRDHLSIEKQIPRRWLLYSCILILGLTLIARLLPTSYSFGFLAMLNYLSTLAIVIVYELTIFVISPFLLLIYWLLSLFKKSAAQPPPLQMPATPPPLPAFQGTGPVPWLELLKSFLFWVVLMGVVGYSLYYYVRERRDLLEAARRLPYYGYLARFWRWLTGWLSRAPRRVSAAVEARLERLRSARQSASRPYPSSYLSLRRLSPRQKVMFYYLAMVRRGGEIGLGRSPAETPYQYARNLSQGLSAQSPGGQPASEVEQDISELTEKFVEARYSLKPTSVQEVSLVKRCWQRLRRLLSRR